MCVCVFVSRCALYRQTNRHSREICEVLAHMRACAHKEGSLAHPWAAVVTSVTLMRSRSSYTHTYTDTRVYMFVCLFFWVYLTAGCLTLIRSRSSYKHTYQHSCLCVCMYIFVLFFVCFSACFLWMGAEILCSSESVKVLSLLDMYLPVFLVLCLCVCVCVCVTVCTGRQTDTVERLAK